MSLGQEIPLHPWTKLGIDLFHLEGASYLLILDYTSRLLVVHKLSSVTGQYVANHCKQIFSEYGWPETLISDNGPSYTVDAFTSVRNAYHVNHITNSPHYLQSNGLAEKYVQIVKSLFYKAKEEGKDLFKCLMIYHNTCLSLLVTACSHQYRSCKADTQDLTYPCLTQLDISLVYSLRN